MGHHHESNIWGGVCNCKLAAICVYPDCWGWICCLGTRVVVDLDSMCYLVGMLNAEQIIIPFAVITLIAGSSLVGWVWLFYRAAKEDVVRHYSNQTTDG